MRRILIVLGTTTAVVGIGVGAWLALRPPPPPPPVALDQQSFEDADRKAYEQWMKELGYTD